MTDKQYAAKNTLALTEKQKDGLAKMIHDGGFKQDLQDVLWRLEKGAASFDRRIARLGIRPTAETSDRAMRSKAFANKRDDEISNLTAAAYRQRWVKVGKADQSLLDPCVEVGSCWKWATGHSLPKRGCDHVHKDGYGSELRACAKHNPLWLILDAVGVKVGASTVDDLIRYARREVRAGLNR